MSTESTHQLSTTDIEAGYENEAWQGWGYLGERQRQADSAGPEWVAQADEIALRLANEQQLTAGEFFAWLNSKNGRYFGDLAFGGWNPEQVEARARGWNLVSRKDIQSWIAAS